MDDIIDIGDVDDDVNELEEWLYCLKIKKKFVSFFKGQNF
jgi:hypothetical protein